MKPITFREQIETLQPSGREYSRNVAGVEPLPIWTDGEQVVSCWKPSFRERLSILFFGKVWLAVLSGRTQYPAFISGAKEYFQKPDAIEDLKEGLI